MKFKTKKEWLDYLFYEIGNQQTDFRLTYTFEKEGDIRFTKWVKYLAAQEKGNLSKFNQREILKNEIVLDLDQGTKDDYLNLIEQLKKEGFKFYAYATEEWRCRHIHLFFDLLGSISRMKREVIRSKFIDKYGCDPSLKVDKHVIPIKHGNHWKTNKPIKLVDSVGGINLARPIIEQYEERKERIKPKEVTAGTILIENYVPNAEHFHKTHPFFYDKQNMFWLWNNDEKKYELVDDVDMMILLDSLLDFRGLTVNSKLKAHYLEAFRRVGRRKIPEDAPTKWIQFKDKAFSLESGNVYEVKPNYFFTNPIPFSLGNTSDTPIMDKLIKEWVGDKYLSTAYEIIAYCCLTNYPIHLIFCLVGCGRNGKSKFLGLIQNFLGKDNTCSTELDILLDSRFESFKLYKKLACIMGETNFNVLSKTSLLKKLTGQDLIGFEFKNKRPFDDYNYAKILISSNSLPVSEDTSDGFYRRWLIIDFPNTFNEGHDVLKNVPESEYNALARKVTEILPKLVQKGKFTNQGTIKERTERYVLASNPLSKFIELHCHREYGKFMRYSEIYTMYRKYLHENKKRRISYKEFNDVLALEGLEVVRTSKQIGTDWVNGRFVEGIELKSCDIGAIYANNYTQKPYVRNEGEKSAQTTPMSQDLVDYEELLDVNHIKCMACGKDPTRYSLDGKYFCSVDCINSYKVNRQKEEYDIK